VSQPRPAAWTSAAVKPIAIALILLPLVHLPSPFPLRNCSRLLEIPSIEHTSRVERSFSAHLKWFDAPRYINHFDRKSENLHFPYIALHAVSTATARSRSPKGPLGKHIHQSLRYHISPLSRSTRIGATSAFREVVPDLGRPKGSPSDIMPFIYPPLPSGPMPVSGGAKQGRQSLHGEYAVQEDVDQGYDGNAVFTEDNGRWDDEEDDSDVSHLVSWFWAPLTMI